MAVATPPTVANLVAEAFLLAGARNPSTALTDRATNRWMQEIAGDLHLTSGTHRELETDQVTVTTEGNARYDLPSDFREAMDLTLLDGSDEDRTTAQAGTVGTITLAANDGASETAGRISKEILLTGGTGVGQIRTITGFNVTTKVATVDQNWTTTPGGSTTYLIVSRYRPLTIHPMSLGVGAALQQTLRGRPQTASMLDRQYQVLPVPDLSTYGFRLRYYLDLLLMDLASTRYLRLIQQWEPIFMAGLIMRVHQNYDDTRYGASRQEYLGLLQALGGQQDDLSNVRFRTV